MEDKIILSTILSNVKGQCDLMMHGTIESVTPNVQSTFNCGLQDCLAMQKELHAKMEAKGWYPTQNVEQTKIDQAKQKFSSSN